MNLERIMETMQDDTVKMLVEQAEEHRLVETDSL